MWVLPMPLFYYSLCRVTRFKKGNEQNRIETAIASNDIRNIQDELHFYKYKLNIQNSLSTNILIIKLKLYIHVGQIIFF